MTKTMTHELKCWPTYFSGIIAGTKTFEVRMDDRPYHEGDTLHLREFIPADETYTGRECRVDVLSVYRNVMGVYNPYCVMGIRLQSEPAGHPCHCEHDPRCDVHRDGSCNCHRLSEKQSWTAGDGPCDCAAREGKLWHAADCSSLKPPQSEPKAGLEDVPFLPISPETLKAYAKQLREHGVVYVKYQDGTATVLQHEDIYLPIGIQNREGSR